MRRIIITLATTTLASLLGCSADPPSVDDGAIDASTPDLGTPARDAASVDDAGVDAAAPAGLPGDPCAKASDCRSAGSPFASLYPTSCIPKMMWAGGYCVDFCTLPADPFVLPDLARADCPAGSVCLPRWFQDERIERADIGGCFKECRVDADCRASEGYYCRHEFWIGMPPSKASFSNGYCTPQHCMTRGCPRSFNCGC